MLVALMALTMSIALMVSTLVMIHHEGQTNRVDRKKNRIPKSLTISFNTQGGTS